VQRGALLHRGMAAADFLSCLPGVFHSPQPTAPGPQMHDRTCPSVFHLSISTPTLSISWLSTIQSTTCVLIPIRPSLTDRPLYCRASVPPPPPPPDWASSAKQSSVNIRPSPPHLPPLALDDDDEAILPVLAGQRDRLVSNRRYSVTCTPTNGQR